MVAKNLEEQFINVMFSLDDEKQLTENYSALKKYLILVKREEIASPYDYITEYVFDHGLTNPDEATIMFDYLRDLYIEHDGEKGDYADTTLKSIARHIRLAIIQQNYIAKQTEEAMRLNKILRNKLVHQSESLRENESSRKELEKKLNDMKMDKSSIYTDFIAILGIFSALIFGLFGGFSAFSSLLQAISTDTKISRAVLLGSLLLIGLLILIFLLLNGIANLADRNIKSCCSNQKCNHNIYQKFPIFVLGITILTSFSGITLLGMIWNFNGGVYAHPFYASFAVIAILAVILYSVIKMIKGNKKNDVETTE